MDCPTANLPFENYTVAAVQYFEAVDKLGALVGQHAVFEDSKKYSEEAFEKCRAGRLALESHWVSHNCRAASKGT